MEPARSSAARSHWEALVEFGVGASDAQTVSDVAALLSQIAAPLVGAANAAVATWTPGDEGIRVYQGPTATVGNSAIRVVRLDEPTPLTIAVRDQTSVHVRSAREFSARFPKIARRTQPGDVTAMFTYPLVLDGEVLGSCFFRFAHDAAIDADRQRLMDLMVALLVRAVARIGDRNALLSHTQQLEQSNRDLADFAAVVAHDFSAPVRRIGSFLHLLRRELDPMPPKAARYAATITGQVEHLHDLLQDTLAYAQAVAPSVQGSVVDLQALASEVVDDLQAELDADDATVHVHDLPVTIGEESLLRQVFENLIENSLKYARPGRAPRIEMTARVDDGAAVADREMWRIAVADNGIGIDPARADEVFAMFARLEVSDDRPGTGVGLALVKRVVERHGGSVGVAPGLDGGATIWFTLPSPTPFDEL